MYLIKLAYFVVKLNLASIYVFECVVLIELWGVITRLTGYRDTPNMVSISNWWSGGDKNTAANMMHVGALWDL